MAKESYTMVGGSWRKTKEAHVYVNSGWRKLKEAYVYANGGWRQWLALAASVTPPTISGAGNIDSGGNGTIVIRNSVSSDGSAVTYEVTGYTGITSISPTIGIMQNGTVSFTVESVTSNTTYSITVIARTASGATSTSVTTTGTIIAAPAVTVTAPSYYGAGTVEQNTNGQFYLYGSVASNGSIVRYEITNYTGIQSISPQTNIYENNYITFRTDSRTSNGTYTIEARARAVNGGAASDTITITGVISYIPPVTVTDPNFSGGGQVNAGGQGVIKLYGSTASDGSTVTYDITSTNGIVVISPQTNISENQNIVFTVINPSSSGTYYIYARAKSAGGISSNVITISGTIYVAPPVTVTAPSYGGAGTVKAGENGSFYLYGSVASDGSAVAYQVITYNNMITYISKTTGISENENVSFTTYNNWENTSYTIDVRAIAAGGQVSPTVRITGTVRVPEIITIVYNSIGNNTGVRTETGTVTQSGNVDFAISQYNIFAQYPPYNTVRASETRYVNSGSTIMITGQSTSPGGPATASIYLNGSLVITWSGPPAIGSSSAIQGSATMTI